VPIANPIAYARGQREGDRNLNRDFREVISRPRALRTGLPIIWRRCWRPTTCCSTLHSFSSQGEAFVFIGPQDNNNELEPFAKAAQEEALASVLGPQRIVHGWIVGICRRRRGTQGHRPHRFGDQ
jgi:hypothetical protein